MASFNITAHKLLVSATSTAADALPVDVRTFVARTLTGMGFNNVIGQETAPSDRRSLWWHNSVKLLKRYNGLTGTWETLTPDLFAKHMLHRVLTSASLDTTVADDDLFPFFDTSLNEVKSISGAMLRAAMASGFLYGNLRIVGYAHVAGSIMPPDYTIQQGVQFVSYNSGNQDTVFKSLGNYGSKVWVMRFTGGSMALDFIGSFNNNQQHTMETPAAGLIYISFG